jgi:hypothetical protein
VQPKSHRENQQQDMITHGGRRTNAAASLLLARITLSRFWDKKKRLEMNIIYLRESAKEYYCQDPSTDDSKVKIKLPN